MDCLHQQDSEKGRFTKAIPRRYESQQRSWKQKTSTFWGNDAFVKTYRSAHRCTILQSIFNFFNNWIII